MLELIVVALLQATEPQTDPANPAQSEAPVAQAPAETSPDVEVTAEQPAETRRCEEAPPTGSRVRTRRVTCTTQDSRDAAAETARAISRSGGAAGQAGEVGGRGQ